MDFKDELHLRTLWEDGLNSTNNGIYAPLSEEEPPARISPHRSKDLQDWDYESPFSYMKVAFDDVDAVFCGRFA